MQRVERAGASRLRTGAVLQSVGRYLRFAEVPISVAGAKDASSTASIKLAGALCKSTGAYLISTGALLKMNGAYLAMAGASVRANGRSK